jgi:hypothetical protein
MLLALLAFLGGALTIISPCILPVLPFVFARGDRSFARGTLTLLAGMALTFALLATLAAVGGAWAVRVNAYGRAFALYYSRVRRRPPVQARGGPSPRRLYARQPLACQYRSRDACCLGGSRRAGISVGTLRRAHPRLILTGAALSDRAHARACCCWHMPWVMTRSHWRPWRARASCGLALIPRGCRLVAPRIGSCGAAGVLAISVGWDGPADAFICQHQSREQSPIDAVHPAAAPRSGWSRQ